MLLSYSQEELNLIEQADEHQFQLLNYAVDHAIYTSEYHEAKHSTLPVVSLKENVNNPTFTDFGLKIKTKINIFIGKVKESYLL